MPIQLLLFIAWLSFFLWMIGRIPFLTKSGIRVFALRAVFLLKILAGTGLTLIYTNYYEDRHTSDIYKFYDDARVIYSKLKTDPLVYTGLITGVEIPGHSTTEAIQEMKNWTALSGPWLRFTQTSNYNLFNSNRVITRINALLMPLSQDFIFTHILFFCFFSLLGLVALFRQVQPEVQQREMAALIIIFFLPSVLLWCSGMLKDGFLLALLNLFFWKLFQQTGKMAIGNRIGGVLFLLILSWLIAITKYYVLLAAVPAILSFIWCRVSMNRQGPLMAYLTVPVILLSIFIIQAEIQPNQPNLWSVLSNKREEALKLAIWADANHQVFFDPVDAGVAAVLKKVPQTLANAILRPHVFEAETLLIALAAVENLLLLLVIAWLIGKPDKKAFSNEMLVFFLSFSLCLAFIIGFTTPVTGGLVRYKTAFIIYLILACLLLGKFAGFQNLRKYFLK